MRCGAGFLRRGVGASEPKKITSPGLRLRMSFYESQERHRVQGGVVAGAGEGCVAALVSR